MASDRRRLSRTDARRRARLAARGEVATEEVEGTEPAPAAPSRGGFLSRMFPPAPPLAGRPDPMAGYSGTDGALRPITSRVFLLRQNVLAWLLPGIAAFVGYIASLSYATGMLGLFGTFVLFGALIAAGWFGWQRPTLFGVAAALVGFVLASALVLYTFASQGAGPDTFGAGLVGQLFVQALYLSGLGFLGGWYGGYLRRRQAQLSTERGRSRTRRR